MPAMYYTIRWPDRTESRCYSPSLVIKDYLNVGQRYDIEDFLARMRTATGIASERVRAKFGYFCSSALDQLQLLEQQAAPFMTATAKAVEVVSFSEGGES
jgi:uncharacterized repeat protein (TIGR04042 family)